MNMILTPILKDKTPFEVLYNSKPDYTDHKIFGCLGFVSTLVNDKRKLDPRAKKCVFLGYKTSTKKGYVMMDLKTREIFLSRNVYFYEVYFTFASSNSSSSLSFPQIQDTSYLDYTELPSSSLPKNINTQSYNPSRTSNRIRKSPSYLQDYHCNHITTHQSSRSVKYPLSSVLSYSNLSPSYTHFILSILSHIEPKTYSKAVKHE